MRQWITTLKRLIPPRPLVFALATKSHWRDAGSWLVYTLLGGLLPFWGTALILLFIQRGQALSAYFQNGELAVFCASLLAAAILVIQRRVKDPPIEHPAYLHFAALGCLAVALLLFASVTITRQVNLDTAEKPSVVLDDSAILSVSVMLFIASISVGFIAELIDNIRMTPQDLVAFATQREARLAEKFDQARKGER